MSYCSNCGHKMEEDSLFCPECGQKLEEETSVFNAAKPEVVLESDDTIILHGDSASTLNEPLNEITDSETTDQAAVSSKEQMEEQTSSKESPRLWGIIGIGLFCVLGGIGYASWFIWILVAFLVLIVIAGSQGTSWWQIGLSAVIILFGTPLLSDSSESSSTATIEVQENINTTEKQTEHHKYVPDDKFKKSVERMFY